jgi:hypothetical protein
MCGGVEGVSHHVGAPTMAFVTILFYGPPP